MYIANELLQQTIFAQSFVQKGTYQPAPVPQYPIIFFTFKAFSDFELVVRLRPGWGRAPATVALRATKVPNNQPAPRPIATSPLQYRSAALAAGQPERLPSSVYVPAPQRKARLRTTVP